MQQRIVLRRQQMPCGGEWRAAAGAAGEGMAFYTDLEVHDVSG
jgi:hypothetical protein